MSTVVGVVGSRDLTSGIASVVRQQPGVVVLELPYAHEDEAPDVVGRHAGEVDGWLFSGIVPYTRASAADGSFANRPAVYLTYSGPTLVSALLQLTQQGHDVGRISIDTLAEADVRRTYLEGGLEPSLVRIRPDTPQTTAAELVEFHRRAHAGPDPTHAAITCVSAVHGAISAEVPTLRLAPLKESIDIALRELLLTISRQLDEDAQVAVGLIRLSGDDDTGLAGEAAALGGSVARATDGSRLLITTRGPLYAATAGFTSLPMLGRLADQHAVVQIGLGLGEAAGDAETRARRALERAGALGDVRAVLSLRDGTDMVLDVPISGASADVSNLAVLARRVGVAVPTLQALQELRRGTQGHPVTTRDIAQHLGTQLRVARRTVHRLELGGLAERAGQLRPGGAGRPLTLYKLSI